MTAPKDRRKLLRAQTALNGIDFVEIANEAQTVLCVHFLNALPVLSGSVTGATITGGDAIPSVPVAPITGGDWSLDGEGRPLLTLSVAAPGDFSLYTLKLLHDGTKLDPYFDHALFSFKAGCESTLDCESAPPACLPEPPDSPVIDYLAKDFPSFKKALSDFSALRFPDWRERSEADFGVMFLEALAAVADDLSYFQDRIAAETSLETATERRSVVRHARLVDYEPAPARCARAMLRFTARPELLSGSVSPGMQVSALGADGRAIEFETGTGMFDPAAGYPIRPAWNQMVPHYWDDADRCLPRGATEMWIVGSGLGLTAGKKLLIESDPLTPGDMPLRQIVTLAAAGVEVTDPLPAPQVITRLTFRAEDALSRERDLTRTRVYGNLVPATQGRRHQESFGIDTGAHPGRALVRTGPNGTPQYLHTLSGAPLAWLVPESSPNARPRPEIRLTRTDTDPHRVWSWRRSLLEAEWEDEVFTVDPARFSLVRSPRADGSVSLEYDGSAGDTLRFGDGVFGLLPEAGTTFAVSYRTGAGAAGNVAADAITAIDASSNLLDLVTAVTNPFPAEGGADAETDQSVRHHAPHAFRAKTFRAVRACDYQAAAETLPWVQRAGTVFRHTGSWLTVFTAADPRGSVQTSIDQTVELVELLDRYRLAGYESYVPPTRYVSLDLEIEVCASPEAFRGDVERAVLAALSPGPAADGTRGFFHPDNFTFGQDLEQSALHAAIQRAYGVDGVPGIDYRRRGFHDDFVSLPTRLAIGVGEIVRVDNNPSRPEHGSIRVLVKGGK